MPDPAAGPHDDTGGPRWRCPQPRQLPELRGELATWLAERGASFYLVCLLHSSQRVRPRAPLPTAAAWLADDEHRWIIDADLYWVSGEMTELALHAGHRLSRFELYEHDLPSRSGFMVFHTPIARTIDDHGIAVEIVAVSWGLLPPSPCCCCCASIASTARRRYPSARTGTTERCGSPSTATPTAISRPTVAASPTPKRSSRPRSGRSCPTTN